MESGTRNLAPAALAYHLVQGALFEMHSSRAKIKEALAALPILSKEDLADANLEESCPICLLPLSSIFTEEEAAEKKRGGESGEGKGREEEVFGVTKLEGCGHVFCRRDLTEWIRSKHGSCPTCRNTFMHIAPLSAQSDDDDESSDGGEYIPQLEDLEDDDDDALIDADAFTEVDVDEAPTGGNMSIEFDRIWPESEEGLHPDAEAPMTLPGVDVDGDSTMGDADTDDEDEDHESEYAYGSWELDLTDGESESMTSSEAGDIGMLGEEVQGAAAANALEWEVSVSVHEDDDPNSKEGEGINTNTDAGALALDVSQQDKEAASS